MIFLQFVNVTRFSAGTNILLLLLMLSISFFNCVWNGLFALLKDILFFIINCMSFSKFVDSLTTGRQFLDRNPYFSASSFCNFPRKASALHVLHTYTYISWAIAGTFSWVRGWKLVFCFTGKKTVLMNLSLRFQYIFGEFERFMSVFWPWQSQKYDQEKGRTNSFSGSDTLTYYFSQDWLLQWLSNSPIKVWIPQKFKSKMLEKLEFV